MKVINKPVTNPIETRPSISISNDSRNLLITIKIEPITAGILIRNKQVFLKKNLTTDMYIEQFVEFMLQLYKQKKVVFSILEITLTLLNKI